MRKILLTAAAALALAGCASDRYTIEGSVEELAGTLYLYNDKNTPIDSVRIEDGAFRLEGRAETPSLVILRAETAAGAPVYGRAILEPGRLKVAASEEGRGLLLTTGTPSNDAYAAYTAAATALVNEYRSPEVSGERREAIQEEYGLLSERALEENPDNYFGAMMLAQSELTGEELIEAIDRFPAALRRSRLLTDLRHTAEQQLRTAVGEPFIEVEQPDASGTPLSLGSVVKHAGNRYVLLDFWASWCGPCMGEVPYLKAAYERYHDEGFEIFGVSLDSDRNAWTDAVERQEMEWIHVSELNGFDTRAVRDYAVQGIPSNFLIDGEGRIVASNLRGEALLEKLAELLDE